MNTSHQQDYLRANKYLEKIINIREGKESKISGILIMNYAGKHFNKKTPDADQVIMIWMDQQDGSQMI